MTLEQKLSKLASGMQLTITKRAGDGTVNKIMNYFDNKIHTVFLSSMTMEHLELYLKSLDLSRPVLFDSMDNTSYEMVQEVNDFMNENLSGMFIVVNVSNFNLHTLPLTPLNQELSLLPNCKLINTKVGISAISELRETHKNSIVYTCQWLNMDDFEFPESKAGKVVLHQKEFDDKNVIIFDGIGKTHPIVKNKIADIIWNNPDTKFILVEYNSAFL